MSRLQSVLSIALSVGHESTDEAILNVVSIVEKAIDTMRKNPKNKETSNSSAALFEKLPANLPSHKNVETQRFHSTRKPKVISDKG